MLGQSLALVGPGRVPSSARPADRKRAKAHRGSCRTQPGAGPYSGRRAGCQPSATAGAPSQSCRRSLKRQAGPEQSEAMAMAYAETGDYRQAVAWQRKAIGAAERGGTRSSRRGSDAAEPHPVRAGRAVPHPMESRHDAVKRVGISLDSPRCGCSLASARARGVAEPV